MVFKKGFSGNPKGKKAKGSDGFEKAIKKVERLHTSTLIEHAINQAYLDNTVLISLLKKILPETITQTEKSGILKIVRYNSTGFEIPETADKTADITDKAIVVPPKTGQDTPVKEG